MRQELALIAAFVAVVVSLLSNTAYQTNTKSPTPAGRAVTKAILSPLIMIAFLTYFKFNFVRLDTVTSAVSGGILVGATAVVLVNTAFPMLPSILRLLVAKWLGIDEKKIQTPDETKNDIVGYDAPSPTYTDEDEEDDGKRRRPRKVKKE